MSKKIHNPNKSILGLFSGQEAMLTIPKIYVELTGTHVKALILNQIVFYSSKTKNKFGFYKKYEEWTQETGLTKRQVSLGAKQLEKEGLITLTVKKANKSPTVHYKANEHNIIKALTNLLEQTCDNDTLSQSQNVTIESDKMSLTNDSDKMSFSITDEEHITTTEEAKPVVVVNENCKTPDSQLRTEYRAKPFVTEHIANEEDFILAAEYSLTHREPGITETQRLHGIIKLVRNNRFEEPKGWAKQSPKIKVDIEERLRLQEEHSKKQFEEFTASWKERPKNQQKNKATIDLLCIGHKLKSGFLLQQS